MKAEAQEKYIELQMLDTEIKQLQQQLANADKQLEELNRLEEALTDFSKISPGTETLSAIGNGIFAKTDIKSAKEVIMAVGANISVEKPTEEAIKVIQEQKKRTEEVISEFESALGTATAKMQVLQGEFENSQKQAK